jgi:hypothetical protein
VLNKRQKNIVASLREIFNIGLLAIANLHEFFHSS